MDFETKLSQRIGMDDIHEIVLLVEHDDRQKQRLYDLVIGDDETIGYHAAWIFTCFLKK